MWCTYLPHLVHLLTFLSWVMSPRDVFPSRVMLPSSQPVSTVVQMAFLAMHARVVLGAVAWVWCTYLTHLVHLLTFLSWVMSPRDVFPSRVMVPSSQPVSTVVQIAFFGNACEDCLKSCCMAVVHILDPTCALADLSHVGYVSPRRVSILCHSSFVAAREFGWSNGVFSAMHARVV